MNTPLLFKELTTKEEIHQSLKLRYEVYSNCQMKTFLHKNKNGLDMDCYDEHARHYGLCSRKEMIGSIRVVLPKEDFKNSYLLELKKDLVDARQLDLADYDCEAPYPFLSYPDLPSAYWDYYSQNKSHHYSLMEGGRLVLKPEYRDLHISKFLIESVFTLYFLLYYAPGNAVVTCTQDHLRFYEFYGFRAIGNCDPYFTNGNYFVSLTIPVATLSGVPKQLHERFYALADEYSSTGIIERSPSSALK